MAIQLLESLSTSQHALSKPFAARLLNAYWTSGAALIISAAFLFSCTSLAVKLNDGALPTFELVLVPGVVCFMATTMAVRSSGLSVQNHSWRITLLTLLRGLLGAASITCFYLAIELLPLQDAVTIFFCSPVVASLLEFAITGESHGWAGAAATACTVLGVVLVSQPECVFHHSGHDHGMAGGSGTTAVGVALATCAAIANAAAFVVVRLIDRAQSTLVLTWWYHGVVVAVSAVPLAVGYPAPAIIPSRRGALLLSAVAATQFVGQLLLNRGFQLESATRGSAINVVQVLFSFVWDVLILGDVPGPAAVTGSSLVAAGVVFMAVSGKTPQPSYHPRPTPFTDDGESYIDQEQPEVVSATAASTPVLVHRSAGSASLGSGRAGGGPHGGGSLDAAEEREAAGEAGHGGRVAVAADAMTEAWVRSRRRQDSRRESGSSGGCSGGQGLSRRVSGEGFVGEALEQPLLRQS